MKVRPRIPVVTALMAAAVLGLAGCGSDAASPSQGPGVITAQGSPVADATGDSGTQAVDPCQWFTAAEMSSLLGFEVTMASEDTPMGYGKECAYNSDAEYTKVTVLPMSAADYDSLKSGTASMTGKTPSPVSGVGDEAYDDGTPGRTNGSVAINAKKGTNAIQVALATASDKIGSVEAGRKIVVPIAVKALG